MTLKDIIHSDPEILGGTPVFVGTRVPVRILLDYLEGGEPLEEFLDNYRACPASRRSPFSKKQGKLLWRNRVRRVLFDENMPRKLRRSVRRER